MSAIIDVNLDGNVGLKLAAHQAALATQSNLVYQHITLCYTVFFFFVQRGLQSGDCLQHLAGIPVPLRSINSVSHPWRQSLRLRPGGARPSTIQKRLPNLGTTGIVRHATG